jgi:hypothetical protein
MDAQTEQQDAEVEQYEWRNVLGNVEHKRCLTDDGRVLEVYHQKNLPENSPFAFVWHIYTEPGMSTKWGNAPSLLEAMQKVEAYAWAEEDSGERAE